MQYGHLLADHCFSHDGISAAPRLLKNAESNFGTVQIRKSRFKLYASVTALPLILRPLPVGRMGLERTGRLGFVSGQRARSETRELALRGRSIVEFA